jgi:hypothetical protein
VTSTQVPHERSAVEDEHAASALARVARAIVVAPIALYQRVISPAIPRRCKYEPTCSRYAVEAIREYGILRGAVLATWRLLRCNPWSYGGYDPVQAQRVFPLGHARASERDIGSEPPPQST